MRVGLLTAVAMALVCLLSAVGLASCTGSSSSSPGKVGSTSTAQPQRTQAIIRVHAGFQYSHPANGSMTSYSGPMTLAAVVASGSRGAKATATTDEHGWATLAVQPGTYDVRPTAPCAVPTTVTVEPSATVTARLECVAP